MKEEGEEVTPAGGPLAGSRTTVVPAGIVIITTPLGNWDRRTIGNEPKPTARHPAHLYVYDGTTVYESVLVLGKAAIIE